MLESYSSQREPAALKGELEGGSPVFLATPTWSRLFLLMTWRGRVKVREQVVSKTQTHTVPTVILDLCLDECFSTCSMLLGQFPKMLNDCLLNTFTS